MRSVTLLVSCPAQSDGVCDGAAGGQPFETLVAHFFISTVCNECLIVAHSFMYRECVGPSERNDFVSIACHFLGKDSLLRSKFVAVTLVQNSKATLLAS